MCNDGSDKFRLSPLLVQCLQNVRDDLGVGININSGYRTYYYNQQSVQNTLKKKQNLFFHLFVCVCVCYVVYV